MSFGEPVRAESDKRDSSPKKEELLKESPKDKSDDSSVHADPATFQKNFCLSIDQKEYTITECEKVVSKIIKPEMSDLEKYYTLAVWANKRVVYDWDFWSGTYHFDYYSHQWDAYGAMKEDEKSVCVGIAIFYSNLCHAADLPCRFARLDPDSLDHTINYIPDINGNAYYADITENLFLLSNKSNVFADFVDKGFAKITKDCTDTTFDYLDEYDYHNSTNIKDCYDITYEDWFNENALHKNTTKKFITDYKEKGSGLPANAPGYHHASYRGDVSNFTDQPDIWFLDDFYKDPAAIKTKILNKEFDEQLLNVSGVKRTYDCVDGNALEKAIAEDISIKYFPSSENGVISAKSANLTNGLDYKVTCTAFNKSAKTAECTVAGIGSYTGQYQFSVKINSSAVAKAPVCKKGLVYDGSAQELIEPGEAEYGEMQYALGTETGPTEEFTTAIPAAVNAGNYYIWYKAVGDETHGQTQQQCVDKPAIVAPIEIGITVNDITVKIGETAVISPEIDTQVPVVFTFQNWHKDIVSVNEDGVVTGIKEGSVTIYVCTALKDPSPNYKVPMDKLVKVKIVSGEVEDSGTPKEEEAGDSGTPKEEEREKPAGAAPSRKAVDRIALNAGVKAVSSGSKVTVSWGAVKGANRYVIYANYCGQKKCRKIRTVKGRTTSIDITRLNGRKLNQKKNLKLFVVAYKKTVSGKKVKLAKSIMVHAPGSRNSRFTNIKAVKVKKGACTLKKGETAGIKAKLVLEKKNKKPLRHETKFRYASSNKKVAKVSRKGKIIAMGQGECIVYVYAVNGSAKKIKVTVE